ncbi:hypothetical protein ACJX0J_008452, partial [Zea mays]
AYQSNLPTCSVYNVAYVAKEPYAICAHEYPLLHTCCPSITSFWGQETHLASSGSICGTKSILVPTRENILVYNLDPKKLLVVNHYTRFTTHTMVEYSFKLPPVFFLRKNILSFLTITKNPILFTNFFVVALDLYLFLLSYRFIYIY